MADGIAPVNSSGSGNEQQQFNSIISTPPTKMSDYPAWVLSQGLGSSLANRFIEKNPELAGSDEAKQSFTSMMQNLMAQVTKSMNKSLDYLKEMDDDEDECAATSFYG